MYFFPSYFKSLCLVISLFTNIYGNGPHYLSFVFQYLCEIRSALGYVLPKLGMSSMFSLTTVKCYGALSQFIKFLLTFLCRHYIYINTVAGRYCH